MTVSPPLQQTVQATSRFLGQFSAVDSVELRAQVGGTLTAIDFQDGQIVHKGDPLFVIDPRPFQIRLDQAVAQLQTAQAKAGAEPRRSCGARSSSSGPISAPRRTSTSAPPTSAARRPRSTPPRRRSGTRSSTSNSPASPRRSPGASARISSPSAAWSAAAAAATSPTTLLATIVSLDPIHLDFDMSEADYLAYQQAHARRRAARRRRDQPRRRRAFRPPRHARLHRQRGEPQQRHHPCPRHGAQSGPAPSRPASSRACASRSASRRRRCWCPPPPSCPTSRGRS